MILGQGSAQTEPEIFDEYRQFLNQSGDVKDPELLKLLEQAPECMQRRIGKPLGQWTEDDILALYRDRKESTWFRYNAFLAFLLFRGYRRASFRLLTEFPGGFFLPRFHWGALAPYRQKLEQTQAELGYFRQCVGGELNVLIALLAWAYKPLEAITRTDFDAFRDLYQRWYQSQHRRKDGHPDPHVRRLEFYLIHWGTLPKATVAYHHEEHFAFLKAPAIRSAILAFLTWCEAKYKPVTIKSYRAALRHFFEWFQTHHPTCGRLDDVTRRQALAYAQYLRDECHFSTLYTISLYQSLRAFFEFVIVERLETSPDRNPFAAKDMPKRTDPLPRYLSDQEVHTILAYCEKDASLKEKTVVTVLFHTGIRAAELAQLTRSDIVAVQGKWKLHIREGKGLKDRMVPLTPECLAALRAWQDQGWERITDRLFTRYGRPWSRNSVTELLHDMGLKLGLPGLTAHRFRHTFAVALLNYGMRESALQKIMGHTTLQMTLHYARILDQTVEQAFTSAVEQMQVGPLSWVPNFLSTGDYSLFIEGDAISWIRLPHGYCRRNPKLHCESDVKCLLCDRFVASPEDLPTLRAMHERFQALGMQVKAEVVAAQIQRLEGQVSHGFIPLKQFAPERSPAVTAGGIPSRPQ